ncbi:hypothetical protein GWK41_02760 [Persephonella atlantica]|uniref:Uncharacterized protein n=1 Tax=Persephonella atlantica TaxID=2699429 RepID=A0ABS1GGD9_9AQUI|nr:hypothetical protein [Persephonella atlantica]MBK3331987.1 hypothetical protein [Persephonella atlantica]
MIQPEKLKKLKIFLQKNGKILKTADIQQIIDQTEDTDLKNFFIALKHITERHYTEAVKWLQLSQCKDANMIISLLSLKVGDFFLYEEYLKEETSEDCLKKENIQIIIEFGEIRKKLDTETLKSLPEILED